MADSNDTFRTKCPRADEVLLGLASGDDAAARRHVAECDQCARMVRFEHQLRAALRQDARRPRQPVADIWRRAQSRRRLRRLGPVLSAAAVLLVAAGMTIGVAVDRLSTEERLVPLERPAPTLYAGDSQPAVEKGIARLRQTQLPDGGWSRTPGDQKSDLDVTTVAALGLLRAGVPNDDPAVVRALDCIARLAQGEAGLPEQEVRDYQTALALLVVLKATGDRKFDRIVTQAQAFLEAAPEGAG